MNKVFSLFFSNYQKYIHKTLPQSLGTAQSELASGSIAIGDLYYASTYSIANGGKHIRPVMVHAAGLAVNASIKASSVDSPACAIELIHTYSLIHDDLPAMDDDDLRRGKPSLHKAYDEATAILVGDGLQARAFELLADAPGLSARAKNRA